MAHAHSVYDSDAHFIINGKTRTVSNASAVKTMVVQHDHNSERFTFEIPRMIDGHDMSICNLVQVHYINISEDTTKQYSGVYEVNDLQISPDSDDVVICSWLISANATQYVGNLSFIVRFACTTDGNVDYAWNTAIHSSVYVSKGIFNGNEIAEEYADILAQWRQNFAELITDEQIDSAVASHIDKTFSANVTQTDDGAVVSVTDSNGTTEVFIPKGERGEPGDKGVKGDPGRRGSQILMISTAPTQSSNSINGKPMAYKISINTVVNQSGQTPQVGDIVFCKPNLYPLYFMDNTNCYFASATSIQGAKGDPGDDYTLNDADKTEIAEMAAGMVEVPEVSMKPLTFTGAVNATYDGSEEVTVEIPQGGGLAGFELIDTIDFSTEEMAKANAGKEYELDNVTEIVAVWKNMKNGTTTASNVLLGVNGGKQNFKIAKTAATNATGLNGYSYFKILCGAGMIALASVGANASTNYEYSTQTQIPYNLIPVKSPITKLSIYNPATQYFAVMGTVEVYVR